MRTKQSGTDTFFDSKIPANHRFIRDGIDRRLALVGYTQESPYHKPNYYLSVVWYYGAYRRFRVYELTRDEYIKMLRHCAKTRQPESKQGFSTRGDFTRGNRHPPAWAKRKYLSGVMSIHGQKDFRL